MPTTSSNRASEQARDLRTVRKSTIRWKRAYYALALLNLVTVGAAFLFGQFLHTQYKSTIETEKFWSTTIDHIMDLNNTVAASNAPGNDVFDSLDPQLERHRKFKADRDFKENIQALRDHLNTAPVHVEDTAQIIEGIDKTESQYRILDAYMQAIFDSISAGQPGTAGSIMATMDRTAADCSYQLTALVKQIGVFQNEYFSNSLNRSENLTLVEFTLLLLFAIVIIVTLLFGRRIFTFLNKQATEAEASQAQADKAKHELSSQTFALDQHSIVAITDTSGKIQYVNDKFCQISKYAREELIGKDHRILNSGHHPTSFFTEMYKTIANGGVWRAEVKNKAKDDSLYWVDTTIVPYRNEAGRIENYVAIRTDITEHVSTQQARSQALAEAKKASEEAEAANKAKSEFLATMSHEIRTPMNSVIGFSNLLLDSNLPDDAENFAKSILTSGQSLLAIINDILDFSKIEAGKLEVESLPFDLRQTAEEAVELLSHQATEKELELLLRYDPDLPRGFHADHGRVRQILINLAGNAIKFTETGHVFVEANRDPMDPQNFVRISVSDTGIGISAEAQNKLFTKFTQADSSTSRKFGGTGLGLAISKLLAELMGGEVGLQSEVGRGSTFWFTLPIPKVPINFPSKDQDLDISNNRILIVDDYTLNRTLLIEQCRLWNLTPESAADGHEALQKLETAANQDDPYKIALVDYCMPGMDGLQLAKQIRANPVIQDTKLIMITSGSFQNERSHFLKSGFDGFFLKPIVKPNQLRLAIAKTLGYQSVEKGLDTSEQKESAVTPPSGRFRLLLVDDTALNQTLLRSILEKKYGYTVDIAGNGEEAVQQYTDFQYDAIFMDCMMPIMDGFEATETIREYEQSKQSPRVPIIALTANALPGDRQKCVASGMDDYLTKPIEQEALIVALNKWLKPKDGAEHKTAQKIEPASPTPSDNKDEYFDLERLLELFGDDTELVSEILSVYTTNLESLAEQARNYEDLQNLRLVSHTIKGSSAECGAELLSSIAKQVEAACKENDTQSLEPLLEKLDTAIGHTQKSVTLALEGIR